jgi:hypothetical protein
MKSFKICSVYWVFKSRRMRWMGHLAFMREFRNLCKPLVGRRRSRGEDFCPFYDQMVGFCEHSKELPGSVKYTEFLD